MGLSYRYIHKCLYGGDDISVRTVDETIPPIMGTAICCMTSEPVPVLQRIGNGPRHDRGDRHHLRTHPLHRAQHNRPIKIRVALGHTAKFEIF